MPFVGMVLGFVTLMVFIVGLVVIALVKIVKGPSGPAARQANEEEARLIQELHRGLGRMEQRIEALEAILLGPDKMGDTK